MVIEPIEVFEYFKEISKIPRGSGNEKAVSDYIVSIGQKHNLEVHQDTVHNVIIKKEGTKGYENSPIVILQGHIDMVCEKNADTIFDFEKDPLKLKIEDGFLVADGTTLCADNGIAVAYMLAILSSSTIEHPPIEALFTSDEETGMGGAINLDYSLLKGRSLINLDSEEEGHILVGCAGGMRTKFTLPINWVKSRMDFKALKITIKGLKGGHSGAEIHMQRGNAHKIMGRLLNNLLKENLIWIRSIDGGNMDNAIPRECESVVCFDPICENTIKGICQAFEDMCKNEYSLVEDGIIVEIEDLETTPALILSRVTALKAVSLLMLIPNGVQTMSVDIDGLVESSNNIGIVKTEREEINFTCALRSSLSSRKALIAEQMKVLADLCAVDFEINSEYPAWEINRNSRLKDVLVKTYEQMYDKTPKIEAIHAGLECGLFSQKLTGADMVSIGPNMENVHTPDERLSIESTKATWQYLQQILKNLKQEVF